MSVAIIKNFCGMHQVRMVTLVKIVSEDDDDVFIRLQTFSRAGYQQLQVVL